MSVSPGAAGTRHALPPSLLCLATSPLGLGLRLGPNTPSSRGDLERLWACSRLGKVGLASLARFLLRGWLGRLDLDLFLEGGAAPIAGAAGRSRALPDVGEGVMGLLFRMSTPAALAVVALPLS